jgi:hypothetical protein
MAVASGCCQAPLQMVCQGHSGGVCAVVCGTQNATTTATLACIRSMPCHVGSPKPHPTRTLVIHTQSRGDQRPPYTLSADTAYTQQPCQGPLSGQHTNLLPHAWPAAADVSHSMMSTLCSSAAVKHTQNLRRSVLCCTAKLGHTGPLRGCCHVPPPSC